ncbi:TPA: hypothetical protein HH296_15870 [Xanthomonas vasicola pv. zeae]|uniref:DotG/IcmE/VirB10 family protein n=1 Tax=Xanthomonas TaxID=338 RepID=UPI0002FD6D60|nr:MULTISPECIES: DotG/IcmE/VirB10 family protein [Xanthomonas]KGT54022.1 hypothetical protein NY96_19775 [Xanthomonas citri pv. fuscans]HHZ23888.1 hypothetical protein [Xanthomonas vasicola pv. zeae]HHZ28461.1 hypothetical protein [Xanthomonas vasicola pv. zeae]
MNMTHTSPGADETPEPAETGSGYEAEGVAGAAPKKAPKQGKAEEWKRNFQAVFGSGIGKVALVGIAVFVLVGIALGIRGLTSKDAPAESAASVDVPNAPPAEINIASVTPEEAKRRAAAAAAEAEAAAAKGGSYQPGFDPNIEKQSITGEGEVRFGDGPPQHQRISVGAGQANAGQAQAGNQPQGQQTTQQQQAEAARQQKQYDDAVKARDAYVNDMRNKFLDQVEQVMGGREERQQRSVNTTMRYYVDKTQQQDGGQQATTGSNQQPGLPQPPAVGAGSNGAMAGAPIGHSAGRKPMIKTGNIMYATLDSEVNTDDGGHVLATVRGGDWDGSKLIGQVEQAPNNIRLNFTVLSPQDGRDTMRINAVALREDDAKQGMADDIDRHTFSRYTALAVASILSGVGQIARQPVGDIIVLPNGQVISSNQEPSDRRIIGSAVGELGSNMSQEIRQGFNRPPTFMTGANRGFALYFLQDVYPQQR